MINLFFILGNLRELSDEDKNKLNELLQKLQEVQAQAQATIAACAAAAQAQAALAAGAGSSGGSGGGTGGGGILRLHAAGQHARAPRRTHRQSAAHGGAEGRRGHPARPGRPLPPPGYSCMDLPGIPQAWPSILPCSALPSVGIS